MVVPDQRGSGGSSSEAEAEAVFTQQSRGSSGAAPAAAAAVPSSSILCSSRSQPTPLMTERRNDAAVGGNGNADVNDGDNTNGDSSSSSCSSSDDDDENNMTMAERALKRHVEAAMTGGAAAGNEGGGSTTAGGCRRTRRSSRAGGVEIHRIKTKRMRRLNEIFWEGDTLYDEEETSSSSSDASSDGGGSDCSNSELARAKKRERKDDANNGHKNRKEVAFNFGSRLHLRKIHDSPHIYVIDNFLTEAELRHVEGKIEKAERMKLWEKSFVDDEGRKGRVKDGGSSGKKRGGGNNGGKSRTKERKEVKGVKEDGVEHKDGRSGSEAICGKNDENGGKTTPDQKGRTNDEGAALSSAAPNSIVGSGSQTSQEEQRQVGGAMVTPDGAGPTATMSDSAASDFVATAAASSSSVERSTPTATTPGANGRSSSHAKSIVADSKSSDGLGSSKKRRPQSTSDSACSSTSPSSEPTPPPPPPKKQRTSTYIHFPPLSDSRIASIESRASTDLLSLPHHCIEPLQVVRYGAGQYFEKHHDMGVLYEDGSVELPPRMSAVRGGTRRVATILVYLNDLPGEGGECGGGTRFPLLKANVPAAAEIGRSDDEDDETPAAAAEDDGGEEDGAPLTVYPKRGRAVLWCNITRDGMPDPRTVHEGLPVCEPEPKPPEELHRRRKVEKRFKVGPEVDHAGGGSEVAAAEKRAGGNEGGAEIVSAFAARTSSSGGATLKFEGCRCHCRCGRCGRPSTEDGGVIAAGPAAGAPLGKVLRAGEEEGAVRAPEEEEAGVVSSTSLAGSRCEGVEVRPLDGSSCVVESGCTTIAADSVTAAVGGGVGRCDESCCCERRYDGPCIQRCQQLQSGAGSGMVGSRCEGVEVAAVVTESLSSTIDGAAQRKAQENRQHQSNVVKYAMNIWACEE